MIEHPDSITMERSDAHGYAWAITGVRCRNLVGLQPRVAPGLPGPHGEAPSATGCCRTEAL